MSPQTVMYRSEVPASAMTVYWWHARVGAFARLTPPWERVELVNHHGGVSNGAIAELRLKLGPIGIRWVARHDDHIEGSRFSDTQIKGPFRHWKHLHRFDAISPTVTILQDEIEYELPLGRIGRWIAGASTKQRLARMFAYRHEVTKRDLQRHQTMLTQRSHRILISGASGLLGTVLSSFLSTGGHKVVRLTRSGTRQEPGAIPWDPEHGVADGSLLEGFDAVIHLAGENIAGGRWTASRKRKIRDSRVQGTRRLAEQLAMCRDKPSVLVSASAVGYYGHQGESELNESAKRGEGFLADVCEAWEQAADPAREAGIRVVHPRFGMILSPAGGALAKMLTPFSLGLGGPLGNGRQWWSWVAVDDAAAAITHAIDVQEVSGPMNVVAPNPVRNREFTRTLAAVLRRPAFLPAPAFGLRLLLGEMADELLLPSQRVLPGVLDRTGFRFAYPTLDAALRHVLGRPDRDGQGGSD